MPTGKLPRQPDHGGLLERLGGVLLRPPVFASWVPSDESDVFVLNGERGRVVVKVERPDLWVVRRERVAFPALRAMGFDEFPIVELTNDELNDGSEWPPFMVMPFTEHRPWNEIWRDNPRQAYWVTERIGSFLRRLAVVDPDAVPGASRSENVTSWFDDWFLPLRMGADREVAALAERCIDHMAGTPDGFGGWQFAQALTDGAVTFTAIDWGNLGRAWPMADLAGAVFGLSRFADRAVDELRTVLLDVYTGGAGLGELRGPFDMWTATWWLLFAAGAARRGDAEDAARLGSYALDVAARR